MATSLLLSTFAIAEEKPFEVEAEVKKDHVNIGDRIKLRLTARDYGKYDILFPEIPKDLGEFTFSGSNSIASRFPGQAGVGRAYVMSIYTTGTHVIPPIEVEYKQKGEAEWKIALSPQVPITIESLLTKESNDILDIKGIFAFGARVFRFMTFVLILLAVLVLVWIIWKGKKKHDQIKKEAKKLSPYELAYEQLKKLENEQFPKKGLIKEYYTGLSDIVRHYLENRFYFRAPEMTTEEFLGFVKRSSKLTREHKELLKEFLSHCDIEYSTLSIYSGALGVAYLASLSPGQKLK